MKCPKCDYLGFETGDRCKNCGYDFSLMAESTTARDADLLLREPGPATGPNDWLKQLDRDLELKPSSLAAPPPGPLAPIPLDTIAVPAATAAGSTMAGAGAARRAVPLPLFQPASIDDDEPLIKMPAAPRPPLAVRRTPESPRLRALPKPARRSGDAAVPHAPDPEPALDFRDEPVVEASIHAQPPTAARRIERSAAMADAGSSGRRLAAAAVDHAILFGIDAVVVYLTLQMAALTVAEWRALPVLPLLAFLGMLKGAYFCAFTLVGGQTIGKMAARIRVVMLDGSEVDPPGAIRRTLAGALSLVSLGLTFIPVLIAIDRRALHDHVARTRVIALR
jgi:uncharacterized RDD family membrane protein YckC